MRKLCDMVKNVLERSSDKGFFLVSKMDYMILYVDFIFNFGRYINCEI